MIAAISALTSEFLAEENIQLGSLLVTQQDEVESSNKLSMNISFYDKVSVSPTTVDNATSGNSVASAPSKQSKNKLKGSDWLTIVCEECCHPEGKTYNDYYNVLIVVSTDTKLNSIANTFYGQNTIQAKKRFRSLFIGEVINGSNKKIKLVRTKMSDLSNKTPIVSVKKTATILEFENKYNVDIDDSYQDLSIFVCLELDVAQMNRDYNTSLKPRDSIQGPISFYEIVSDQQALIGKNKRFHKLENSLLKAGSLDIITKVNQNNNKTRRSRNSLQKSFWVAKNNQDINTGFFAFNKKQLVQDLSFIGNLKDSSIYENVAIEKMTLSKTINNKTNESILLAETKEGPDKSFISTTTSAQASQSGDKIAMVEEQATGKKNTKLLKFDDFTKSLDQYKYKVSFAFRDPSILYLGQQYDELRTLIDDCEKIFLSKAAMIPGDSKKQTILSCVNKYISILDNFDTTPQSAKEYLISLSDLQNNDASHEAFIKIVSALQNTLAKLTTGISSKGTQGIQAENSLGSLKKSNGLVMKEFFSNTIKNTRNYGFDFLSAIEPKNNSTAEPTDKTKHELKITKQDFIKRGNSEILKFWDAIPSEADIKGSKQIIEKAKFVWTPNIVVGGNKSLNLSSVPSYDETFHKKVNGVKTAIGGKLDVDEEDFVDVFTSGFSITFQDSSEAISINESTPYMRDNSNFISSNVDQTYNSEQIKLETKDLYRLIGPKGQSQLENHFTPKKKHKKNKINLDEKDPESILTKRDPNTLPPSYQAYINRHGGKTKFSKDLNRYKDLNSATNSSIVENFMNVNARVEYLEINEENIAASKWKELDSSTLEINENLFCRVARIQDKELNIHDDDDGEIYRRYFSIVQK